MAKKKEVAKEEKKYPSLILGLDISTACIGASIVYDDGVNEPKIINLTHVVPKIPSKIKGIEALIMRKEIFEREFLNKIKDMGITECVIEAPLIYTTGNSNAQTVSQLLQFNALLSEAVYYTLGIIPIPYSSQEARMKSFPQLLSIRKFNKKGSIYPLSHIKKAIKDNHLILFGSYPFDCDKKNIMMNMVCEKYPDTTWIYDKNGELKKENYDACDSLVCVLAHVNVKRYGEMKPEIISSSIVENSEGATVEYTMKIWDKTYDKKIIIKNEACE